MSFPLIMLIKLLLRERMKEERKDFEDEVCAVEGWKDEGFTWSNHCDFAESEIFY